MSDQRGVFQLPVAGVTLIAVLLMVSVLGLLMGRAAQTWNSLTMRNLEEELIYRGEQYRWAIEQFYQANRRPPTTIEELCPEETGNRRYIRRCWDDPITGEPFRLISRGQEGLRRQQNEAKRAQEEREADPLLGGFDERSDRERNSSVRDEGPTRSSVEFGLPGQESRQQLDGDRPFVGVASESDLEGFKSYLESNVYSEWEFVANIQELARRSGTTAPGPNAPNNPNNPNAPTTSNNPNNPNLPNQRTNPNFPNPGANRGVPGGQQGRQQGRNQR